MIIDVQDANRTITGATANSLAVYVAGSPCCPSQIHGRKGTLRKHCWASQQWHPRGAAFSLIELVIVLLVMGVFAAVSIPTFFDSLLFHRVESAARRVKSDLELVRQTARLTSSAQSFTVTGMTYATSSAITALDHPGQTYFVDLSKSPYLLDVLAANFESFTDVSFDGYGKPTRGGTVILEARDHRCTVTLDATTGQVSIGSTHTRSRHAKVAVVQ